VRGGSTAAEAGGSQSTGGGAGSTSSTAPVISPGSAGGTTSGPGGSTTGAATSAAKPAPAAASHASAGSTINLGNVGTYSGVIGAVFSGAQQTLQVWQAYTNAHGGLNGHPVHLFIEDDGADPSTSATEVQQEVTQDHVIAFVGNLVPLTVNASVSYLQQQHIPVIGGDASSVEWWQSPVLFPEGGSDVGPYQAVFTIKQAVAKGDSKMGLLYCVEDTTCTNGYNELIQQGAAKNAGVDPVYTSSFSITQPDFTAQCINAKQAGANFIYFEGDSDSLIRMANDCAAQSYDPLYVADSIAVTAQLTTNPHLNGLIAGQTNFPWIDSFTPAQAQYQQAMKTYAPTVKGSATSAAEWTAGMLAVAASSALTATPTSAEFFQGLWNIKNNNLGGLAPPLTFNANAPATPSNCFFLMVLQNGQFVDVQNGGTQCVS
jgi:branched-chain amino acid transport system substrate-binding protein